jgi:dTDP-4-dehydrorhamnose reductase
MKILIYGSRGWIGNQFKEILENQNINYTEAAKNEFPASGGAL